MQDQDGGRHLPDKGDRTERVVAVRPDALPAGAAAEPRLEVRQIALGHHHAPVADPRAHHARPEALGLPDRPGGHEAALAPAPDAEAVGVGDPLRDQPVEPGDDVPPILQPDRARDGGGEADAVAHPAARVRQEDRVARRRQPLPRGRPTELEAVGEAAVGAAVDDRDQREGAVLAALAGRQDQQPVERQPVGGDPGEPFLPAPRDGPQRRLHVGHALQRPRRRPGPDLGRLVGRAVDAGDGPPVVAGGQR